MISVHKKLMISVQFIDELNWYHDIIINIAERINIFIERFDNMQTLVLLKADLLRRNGEFEKVIEEYGEKFFPNSVMLLTSQYQVRFAREKDDSVHKMSDIKGRADKWYLPKTDGLPSVFYFAVDKRNSNIYVYLSIITYFYV